MGNVAAFKARLTLESDSYIASWKKVEAATSNSVGGIQGAIQKGMKSWSRSMGKAVAGFLGIQLADTLLKSIDDTLKNPIFNNAGANIAYAIGEGLSKTLEGIPVAGTLGKWIGSGIGAAMDKIGEFGAWAEKKTKGIWGVEQAAGALGSLSGSGGSAEEAQKASREEAARNEAAYAAIAKTVNSLQAQKELASAISDTERKRVESSQRLSEILTSLNNEMLKQGKTGEEIQAAAKKVRESYAAMEKAQADAEKARAAAIEREQALADSRARTKAMGEQEVQLKERIAELDSQILGYGTEEEKLAAKQRKNAEDQKARIEKILDLQEKLRDIKDRLDSAKQVAGKMTDAERAQAVSEKLYLEELIRLESITGEREKQLALAEEMARANAVAAKAEKDRQAAEAEHTRTVSGFMQQLQDALDERTMTEDQLFQKKMDRLGLDAEEQANALALNEKLKAAEASSTKTATVSNIESIQTAVGSVKMAGTTSGLDKLARPAEATAKATQASAQHLARIAASTGAV